MSDTTTASTRREAQTTPTSSRKQSVTDGVSSQQTLHSSSIQRQSSSSSSIQLDTSTPTPSATAQDPPDEVAVLTASSAQPTTTCSPDRQCAGSNICSRGACEAALDGAPFGEGSTLGPTSHMSTEAAVGVGLGVVASILLLFGLMIWIWRRRGRKSVSESIEAPAPNRNRSASSATDQKTLVASLPNSPQQAGFREQNDEMHTAAFAQLVTGNKIRNHSRTEKEIFAHEKQQSMGNPSLRSPLPNEKNLPLPPNDGPLPPPPTEGDKRYAINVNINKSMIFDDVMSNLVRTPRDSTTSRDRMPKYRFEEYLPPVVRTPPISVRRFEAIQPIPAIELVPYPRKDSAAIGSIADDEQDDERRSERHKSLKIVDKEPPQLPHPELLPPPSPSFSFRSYDWYQDIIGTEQTNLDDTLAKTSSPSIPDRNPARTPTKTTFGASLSSHPSDSDRDLYPPPLSPSRATHLHPNTASTVLSPTTPNFRLSPTVYTMPSRPSKAQPLRASLQSTMTQKTHMSRSWLPDDGLYLPEEGTHDSYMMFKKRLSDDMSRPTSYSPF
jgi:hypothetical protein